MPASGLQVAGALRGCESSPAAEPIGAGEAAGLADLGEPIAAVVKPMPGIAMSRPMRAFAGEGRSQLLVELLHLGGDLIDEPQRRSDAARSSSGSGAPARNARPAAHKSVRVSGWM